MNPHYLTRHLSKKSVNAEKIGIHGLLNITIARQRELILEPIKHLPNPYCLRI